MTSRTHYLLSTCGVAALLLIPSFAQPAPQTNPSPKSTKQPPSSLMSDARAVLGKVNYDRARELTQKLQATLRTIKSRQRDIVSARTDPSKQRKLEVQLDEDLGEAMEETIAILDFLHEYGFEDVIYKHKEELSKGFTLAPEVWLLWEMAPLRSLLRSCRPSHSAYYRLSAADCLLWATV
jgi:hypothetical protein